MTSGTAALDEDETTVERVYRQLKEMAISFEFPPGGRVNELAVARRIGVSRTPLREALNRLTADGFLTFSRKQGFFRKPLSVKTVADLYEWRGQLQRGVVRLVIERASDAALEEVQALVSATGDVSARSGMEILQIDERFLQALTALTGNVEFVETIGNLHDRIRFVRWVDMESRRERCLGRHQMILDALKSRDVARAEALIAEHVALPEERMVAAVKDAFARIYMNREGPFIPPV